MTQKSIRYRSAKGRFLPRLVQIKKIPIYHSYLIIIGGEVLALIGRERRFGKRDAAIFNCIGHYGGAVINPDWNCYNCLDLDEDIEVVIVEKDGSLAKGEKLYLDYWRHRPNHDEGPALQYAEKSFSF